MDSYLLPLWRADRQTFTQHLGQGERLGSSGLLGWSLKSVDRYTLELLPAYRIVKPGELPGWTTEEAPAWRVV